MMQTCFTVFTWMRSACCAVRFSRCICLHICLATLGLTCASCASSPPTHFYTLSKEIPSESVAAAPRLPLSEKQYRQHAQQNAQQDELENALPTQATAKFYIEVSTVQIPAQVDRPQFVITTTPGQVEIKEQQRWSAPLQDEIRQVISESLMKQLRTFDVAQTHIVTDLPIYRLTIKVQHFTSSLTPSAHTPTSGTATVSMLWNIRPISQHATQQAATLTCHSFASESVKPNYATLALGHRRALQRIAQEIAMAIRTMTCPTVKE